MWVWSIRWTILQSLLVFQVSQVSLISVLFPRFLNFACFCFFLLSLCLFLTNTFDYVFVKVFWRRRVWAQPLIANKPDNVPAQQKPVRSDKVWYKTCVMRNWTAFPLWRSDLLSLTLLSVRNHMTQFVLLLLCVFSPITPCSGALESCGEWGMDHLKHQVSDDTVHLLAYTAASHQWKVNALGENRFKHLIMDLCVSLQGHIKKQRSIY